MIHKNMKMELVSVLGSKIVIVVLLTSQVMIKGKGDYYTHGSHHEQHKGHVHQRPASGSQLNLQGSFYDKQHIIEDVKDSYRIDINPNEVNEEDIQFYYFHTHDTDKNGKLDGLEILYAMNHILGEPEDPLSLSSSTTPKPDPENDGLIEEFYRMRSQIKWNSKFAEDAGVIDGLFEKYDSDKDGFLSWNEYVIASKNL